MGKPNFYSILPAYIRYDEKLTDKAKLIFSEITSLCNANGECYVQNKYFENQYSLSERTVTRIISLLKNRGYIEINYIYKTKSKEIEKRIISIPKNITNEVVSKMTPGGVKNGEDNNIKKYNISKDILYKEKNKLPTFEEISEYAKKRNVKFVDCEYFYNYFNDNDWVDSKGRKVRSWKQKLLTWEKHEKERHKGSDECEQYTRI